MAKQKAKPDDKFEVHHTEKDGKHFLHFIPAVKNEGYPPKEVAVTEEQWHALKYHFAVGTNVVTSDEKIVYIY